MMFPRTGLPVVCALAVLLSTGCREQPAGDAKSADATRGQQGPAGQQRGDIAERPGDIAVTDLDGQPVDLLGGGDRLLAIVFLTTDCPIANRYAPKLNRLFAEFEEQGVQPALIYPNPRDTPAAIRKHLTDYAYSVPAYRDPAHSLVAFCGATVTPEAALVKSSGELLYCGRIDDWYVDFGKYRSQPTTDDFRAAVTSVLAGQPVSQRRTKAVGCYIPEKETDQSRSP